MITPVIHFVCSEKVTFTQTVYEQQTLVPDSGSLLSSTLADTHAECAALCSAEDHCSDIILEEGAPGGRKCYLLTEGGAGITGNPVEMWERHDKPFM